MAETKSRPKEVDVVVVCMDGSVTLSRSCAERLPLLKDILADLNNVEQPIGYDYIIPAESTMQELYHALSYVHDGTVRAGCDDGKVFTRAQLPGLMYWQVVDAKSQPIDDKLIEHYHLESEKIASLKCERYYNKSLGIRSACAVCRRGVCELRSRFCANHACVDSDCIRVRGHSDDHLCRKPNMGERTG